MVSNTSTLPYGEVNILEMLLCEGEEEKTRNT